MAEQPGLIKSIIKKGVLGVVVGAVLVGLAKALAFPPLFQVMFFTYAMLGTVVFILLDAPSVKPIGGAKALVSLVVLYIVFSGVYICGTSLWRHFELDAEK